MANPNPTPPPVATRFQPGNPGRPKGSRNKLAESFFDALTRDFDEHGAEVIIAARAESPLGYLNVVAKVIPQKLEIEKIASQVTDAELLAIIRNVPALQLAAPVEAEPVTVEAEEGA